MRRTLLILALLPTACAPAPLRHGETPPLTVERIFSSSEFSSRGFSARWDREGAAYLRVERRPGDAKGASLVRRDAASGREEVLVSAADLVPPGAAEPLSLEGYEASADFSRLLIFTNSRRVWRRNTRGDYWVLDRTSRTLRKLGGDAPASSLMFAKLSPDARRAAYVRAGDLYLEDLRDGTIRRLTRSEDSRVVHGTSDWVYEEEFDLRDGFSWSPDGARLAYWQIDSREVPSFPLVDTSGKLYPKVTWIGYPKVGQANPSARIGILELRTGETCWVQVPGDPRDHYLPRMQWAPDSAELIVQQLNRRQNMNRVFRADSATGVATPVLVEKDEAWVDVQDELDWLPGGRSFLWTSERDGWRRLYATPRAGGEPVLVTRGDFDVIRMLQADPAGEWVYYLAAPGEPTRRYLYRSRTDGTRTERLTPPDAPGTHEYSLSPDARWAFHTYSSFDRPPATRLVELPSHRAVSTLADNAALKEKVDALGLPPTEPLRVDIGGGVVLDGWCIRPPVLEGDERHPLLVYVYGEPAGQTVLDRWGGGQGLWHRMLAQRGYVVVSFDNRGTPAPRGRDWRKCVYGKIGILAPEEQAAAVRQLLKERPYLDPARVGVWGWSGGGSMSLNAIFRYPDLYRAAVAIASVPDQRGYDTIYQERYMGLLPDNEKGYREGSPITHAKNLRGELLLIHGTGDDNCHYATAELLIDELVRHHKPFSMFAYPNRSHAISEGPGTTRHLWEMITRFFLEKLPAKRHGSSG
jgi:dipeptidyl-peptidase-4